jgi:hypothetical protein
VPPCRGTCRCGARAYLLTPSIVESDLFERCVIGTKPSPRATSTGPSGHEAQLPNRVINERTDEEAGAAKLQTYSSLSISFRCVAHQKLAVGRIGSGICGHTCKCRGRRIHKEASAARRRGFHVIAIGQAPQLPVHVLHGQTAQWRLPCPQVEEALSFVPHPQPVVLERDGRYRVLPLRLDQC